jgi:hypothetical protein
MKTTSTFALLDVKLGREKLRKLVEDHKLKVPVTIKGYVVGPWSGDDQTSIEFEVQVTSHKLGKPIVQKCRCIRCHPRRNGPALTKGQ